MSQPNSVSNGHEVKQKSSSQDIDIPATGSLQKPDNPVEDTATAIFAEPGSSSHLPQSAASPKSSLPFSKDRVSILTAGFRGRELQLLGWLGIAWPPEKRASHINCPFPDHTDNNPSWRWDGRKKAWFCTCGSGDLIGAVMRMRGGRFQDACDLIEHEFLGLASEVHGTKTAGRRKRGSAVQRAHDGLAAIEAEDPAAGDAGDAVEAAIEKSRLAAQRYWDEAAPIAGTLAQHYFEEHRGIRCDWDALTGAIRFHARVWCSERKGRFPSILFRVAKAPDAGLMTVHRLYLAEDGGKARVQEPKMAYGPYKSGAIWFGQADGNGELVKAEGPENALVCIMAGRPLVACCIAAANLDDVMTPAGIGRMLIAGDRGEAGEKAADAAALAGQQHKLDAAIAYPPARPKPNGKWQDWNDLLHSDGLDAVREALLQSEPVREELPEGFRWTDKGSIEYLTRRARQRDGDEDEEPEWDWLCSPVKFLATTLNAESKGWGHFLQIRTRNGIWHTTAVPKTELVTTSEDFLKHLAFLGLDFNIGPRGKTKLRELLVRVRPKSYALCVPKVGFHDGVFVLPERTIGNIKGRTVVFQPSKPIDHAYKRAGTLKGWQDGIAAPARGNSRLIFAIATALAAPLLEPLNMEGGGIHFRSNSTGGKTTIMRAAGTVWGGGGQYGFIRTWRSTDNALEGIAVAHNNAFLALDEIAEIEPKALFKAAYALANGRQKERMNKTTELRGAATWRLLFMSTGEIGLAEKLAEERMHTTGGQAVRLVEIHADANKGAGVFENLHGFTEAKLFAEALDAAGREHYGHAAPAFIKHITDDLEAATRTARVFTASFVRKVCAAEVDGQVKRVAQRFGLIAAAAEMATAAGVLPWSKGESKAAAEQLFKVWLAARGTTGPIEITTGITQVRRVIERDGASRFTPWDNPDHQTINRLGFVRTIDEKQVFYVLPEAWKEICQGQNPAAIAKALVERKAMAPGKDGKSSKGVRLPRMGVRRCYEIHASLLPDEEGAPHEPPDKDEHAAASAVNDPRAYVN